MESKKLQTILKDGGPFYQLAGMDRSTCDMESVWAFRHDARIAHEQREVIRQLVDALNGCRVRLGIHMKHTEDLMADVAAHNALKAAAPYLQED